MCGFCKPPQSLEASKGCADCKSNFCNECFKLYHPWGTPRAQHEHILPTNSFRPKVCLFPCVAPCILWLLFCCHCAQPSFVLQVLTCTEHEQERLQWYCRDCQRLLCPLCKLRQVHHGHKVLPMAQAYQALKVSPFQLGSDRDVRSIEILTVRLWSHRTRLPRRSPLSWPTRRRYRVRSLNWKLPSNRWR